MRVIRMLFTLEVDTEAEQPLGRPTPNLMMPHLIWKPKLYAAITIFKSKLSTSAPILRVKSILEVAVKSF